jgi:hypothetical protein
MVVPCQGDYEGIKYVWMVCLKMKYSKDKLDKTVMIDADGTQKD